MTYGHSHMALGLYLIEELASDAASLVLPKLIHSYSNHTHKPDLN
jgi:hypothetical protein